MARKHRRSISYFAGVGNAGLLDASAVQLIDASGVALLDASGGTMPVDINSTSAVIPSIAMKQQSSAPAAPASGFDLLYVDTVGTFWAIGNDGIPHRIGGQAIGCSLTNSGTFTITSGGTLSTAIGWDTETWINGITHSTSVNNSQITVVTGGKYYIYATVQIPPGSETGGIGLQLSVNAGTSAFGQFNNQGTSGNNFNPYAKFDAIKNLVVGDVVVIKAGQQTGSTRTVSALGANLYMAMIGT